MLTWLVGGFFLVVRPRLDVAHRDGSDRADAVFVLGGIFTDNRIDRGLQLVKAGYADNLVLSLPNVPPSQIRAMCRDNLGSVTVTCFKPDPKTTKGEAEEIRRLAREHGWQRILVVTSTYHVSRARLILQRCVSSVRVTDSHARISFGTFAYQYLYQSAGFLKAYLHPDC